MRLALVTCHPFPEGVVDDEEPLRAALRRRGTEVVEVPWDADVDWSTFDLALLRTPWDYQARPEAFLAWCERCARATRLVHDAAIVRWNLDKRYLRELAGAVPVAPTAWIAAGPKDLAHLRAEISKLDGVLGATEELLAKPVVGANAFLAARFPRTVEGLDRLATHVAGRDFMVQPYLESVESEGELSLVWIEGVGVTHGVRKVPARGDFRVQEDHGARDMAWEPDLAARELADRAIAAAEARPALTGTRILYARVDLLVGADGYVLNELELVEPALFMRHFPGVGEALAARVLNLG